MAKQVLPTDFKDDILNKSMRGQRRYTEVSNTDGTISLVDASDYDQVGSAFGAAQINATNAAVNESADKNTIIDKLSDVAANTTGGKIAGALALKELNNNLGGFTPQIDPSSGRITGYKTTRGADTVFPFSSVIFKSGPGPWDFSEEFPGGVGFDVNNCKPIVSVIDSCRTDFWGNKGEWTSCRARNIKCSGTYDNVKNASDGLITDTGWNWTGGGLTISGCVYILPED